MGKKYDFKGKPRSADSIPLDIFKHCIGWNNYNIPRANGKSLILYSYRNRFVLSKEDTCLTRAVKEGYMTISDYGNNLNLYKLTNKGYKYVEEAEDIKIVKDIDMQALHDRYKKANSFTSSDVNDEKEINNQPEIVERKRKQHKITDGTARKAKAKEYYKQYYLKKKKEKQNASK